MEYREWSLSDYTIPSDNRELQPSPVKITFKVNYTIPSDNRELQRRTYYPDYLRNYTIPSDNRELQLAAFTSAVA